MLGPAGVALALFLLAFARLRRRGRDDHASWGRVPLFLAGLAALTLPLLSPLDPIADSYLLSGHMLEHVLIGDAAPALLLAAVRGPLLLFLLPPWALRALARLGPLRALLRALLDPRASLACWAVAIGCWHVPAVYDYTLGHQTVHDLEHLSFFLAGLLVWAQLIDPLRRARLSDGRRLGYALVLLVFGAALANVLFLSYRPLYPAYAAQHTRLLGLSPLADQDAAGLVMLAEQLLTLGTFALLTLRRSPLAVGLTAARSDSHPFVA